MTIKNTLLKNLICLMLLAFSATTYAQTFWSEDFSAGIPASWTLVDNTGANGLLWAETTVGATGAFATAPLHEPGMDETWVIYDSDVDCSGNQDAWIITDAIDCSDKAGVWLNFDQLYREFFCDTYIRVSTDLNAPYDTWGEVQINDVETTEFGPDEISVNLSAFAAMEATVFVAFEFRNLAAQAPAGQGGCAYNWQVDNIELTDIDPTPQNDMVISSDFFAIAPYAQWPISQVEPFGFLADVANIGQGTQTGVALNVTINDDASGNVEYTADLDSYGTMAPGDTVENQLFMDAGYTPTEVTSYTGAYTISADLDDDVPENNVGNFNFLVTTDVFAKESGPTSGTSAATPDGEPATWGFGNHFYMPNGDGYVANEVSFAMVNSPTQSDVTGNVITFFLYEWTDVVVAPAGTETVITNTQRNRVGFASHTITGNENFEIISLDLFDFASSQVGVELKDDMHYILMAEYEAPDDQSFFMGVSDEYNYGAMTLRSEELGVPRYGSILVVGDLTGDFGTRGFQGNPVPVLRLGMAESTAVKPVLSSDNTVELFPSPAQSYVNVKLDFVAQQEIVALQVVDVTGKVVQELQLEEVETEQIQLQLRDLPQGSYFLNVNTNIGQRSVPFMIQR